MGEKCQGKMNLYMNSDALSLHKSTTIIMQKKITISDPEAYVNVLEWINA